MILTRRLRDADFPNISISGRQGLWHPVCAAGGGDGGGESRGRWTRGLIFSADLLAGGSPAGLCGAGSEAWVWSWQGRPSGIACPGHGWVQAGVGGTWFVCATCADDRNLALAWAAGVERRRMLCWVGSPSRGAALTCLWSGPWRWGISVPGVGALLRVGPGPDKGEEAQGDLPPPWCLISARCCHEVHVTEDVASPAGRCPPAPASCPRVQATSVAASSQDRAVLLGRRPAALPLRPCQADLPPDCP